MSVLNTNKLTWFKNGGEPLKSGYVYVGQPLLDPQVPTNQAVVTFTDSQGNSFPATQPLRTNSDGAVQWNGKAIIATVEGDYSLLIFDSTETEINGGWIPTVAGETSTGTDLASYREYDLTLADIKQLAVVPGQTVGNVGKITASDGIGSDWLVVSNTGGAGDDIDLIDFDNGLQGERINNAAEYTGFTALPTYYVFDDGVSTDAFSVSSSVSIDTWESVGPTGSGADNEWTGLDGIPVGYKGVELIVYNGAVAIGNDSTNFAFYYRKTGSVALPTAYPFGWLNLTAGDQNLDIFRPVDRVSAPVDGNGLFDVRYSGPIGPTPSIQIYVVGFYK